MVTGTLRAWTEETCTAAVKARSAGRCEICGGQGQSRAHRTRRSQGGLWTPHNVLHLCGDGTTGCHGHLTGHPDQAKTGGWEVESSGDPATRPVWIRHELCPTGGWVRLTYAPDDGAHLVRTVDPAVAARLGLPTAPAMPLAVAA